MYVGYIDESGKGGPVFVVGALTATPDRWKAFSEEWQSILDTPPRLPYFHLSDPQGLSPQSIAHKVARFIEVINASVERGDLVLIHVEQYKAFFARKATATRDQPFHQGYVHIMQQCALHLPNPNSTIDLVFDEIDDTSYLELVVAYHRFKKICPDPAVAARFGAEPIRRKDEFVLPLQAADLWVGLMRRTYEGDSPAAGDLKKIKVPNRAFIWDEPNLRKLQASSEAHTPGFGLGHFYEDKKERSKRLKPARKKLRKPILG